MRETNSSYLCLPWMLLLCESWQAELLKHIFEILLQGHGSSDRFEVATFCVCKSVFQGTEVTNGLFWHRQGKDQICYKAAILLQTACIQP